MSGPGGGGALRWRIDEIEAVLQEPWPGCTAEHVASLDSTNSELMRRARAGRFAPVLLAAEHQTAGRGRLGRSWLSSTQDTTAAAPVPTLTFSLGVPLAPTDWSGLSLAVGVAVARALHPELGLKWPNDIWLQQRKLAGILVETVGMERGRYVIVGVGINIASRDAVGLSTPPAWLQELLPGIDAGATLARVAAPMAAALRLFEAQGFAAFEAAYRERDVLRGQPVSLSDGSVGTAAGVDERGALLVHTCAGMKIVNSAEVSVRPLPTPPGAA